MYNKVYHCLSRIAVSGQQWSSDAAGAMSAQLGVSREYGAIWSQFPPSGTNQSS